jgi:predicted transcriptional regulator
MAGQDKLTPVEWEIMEAVWDLGGSPSVREVLEHAFPEGEKAYTTVQTIMNTLEKKGFLERKKTGMVNFYRPVRSREEMEREEMSSIVSRIFGGSKPALASSLLSLEGIALEDLEQIKDMIARREKELKEDTE